MDPERHELRLWHCTSSAAVGEISVIGHFAHCHGGCGEGRLLRMSWCETDMVRLKDDVSWATGSRGPCEWLRAAIQDPTHWIRLEGSRELTTRCRT